MNIGEAVNNIKKSYPSVSISRLRFLEKENLIKPTRTKGGTRIYSEKDINTKMIWEELKDKEND